MQNRYVADVGDFGKYGLLRWLGWNTGLRLGGNWYLVPNGSGNADGRHTEYLEPTKENEFRFRGCDPCLRGALRKIIDDKDRRVQRIRTDSILPGKPSFHEELLKWDGARATSRAGIEARKKRRQEWVKSGQEELRDCELVFFDPDNGLETKTKRHHSKGPKYVFFDEILPYYQRGASIIIYQHMNHLVKAVVQVRDRVRDIKRRLNAQDCLPLLYHRGTARAFLIVPTQAHTEVLKASVKEFLASAWGKQGHFEMVE